MKLWRKLRSKGQGDAQPRPSFQSPLKSNPRALPQQHNPQQLRRGDHRVHYAVASAGHTVISDDDAFEDPGQHGMFILSDKAEEATGVVDIIAIHGLNGHYKKTWTAVSSSGKECNWLQDLLPTQLPNARIMSYGYNSAVQFSKSTAGIGEFADQLLEDILSYRNSEAEKGRPVIFICHSLGGIVFKKVNFLKFLQKLQTHVNSLDANEDTGRL